ncbi:MAG: SDR family oxidoreductase [Sphingomonadaceae bacterium]|nr:SDR family oxidoreductase [Sphingomonadaceae bacterium]
MAQFEGKVAVITGAGRGIGRETALLMAREGARIVVNDLGGGPQGGGSDAHFAQEVVDEIKAAGGEAVAETSSVTTMEGGKAVVDCAMDNFGRLDFLVNNAGIIRPRRLTDMSEEDFDIVVAVNFKGYFATMHAAAPHLKKQGGAIVNFSSPSGFGHYGMVNYSGAKEGVVGMTRTIARELAEFGVRANAVRPISGPSNMNIPEVYETLQYALDTLHIPPLSGHWIGNSGPDGRPWNVAAVVGWLCSDRSSNLNGREVYINGGHIALVQEPEFIRSQFAVDGWTFDKLCEEGTSRALTWDIRDRFTGK